jgi:hypothetical protein
MCRVSLFHLWGSTPTNTWNIALLSFFIFLIVFSGSRTARTTEPILMVDNSKRVFWRQEVPLGSDRWRNKIWVMISLKTANFRPRNAISPLKKNRLQKENRARNTKNFTGTLSVNQGRSVRIRHFESSPTPSSSQKRSDVISGLINQAYNSPTVTLRQKVTMKHK